MSKRTRLGKDVIRYRELADVVQQRRRLDSLDLGVRHPERLAKRRRIDLSSADVALADLVLCVDCQSERFDGSQMQVRHFLHVPLLIDDPADEELVGPVSQSQRYDRDEGHPGADAGHNRMRRKCNHRGRSGHEHTDAV